MSEDDIADMLDYARSHPPQSELDRTSGAWELFHQLWSKAKGTAGYDKREWQILELLLPIGPRIQ
jgi:hypothetical protein